VSYKDSKSFHKDYDDGGRKARKGIEQIAERKANKHAHRANSAEDVSNGNANPDTNILECNDCGYIGVANEDFAFVLVGDDGAGREDREFECPVCNSHEVQEYDGEMF